MREGYSFKAFLPQDDAFEIWDQIEDPTSSTQTITMPSSGYSELSISFVLGAPIVAIELAEEPKTEYTVGSNFVAPKVNSIEENGSKVELDSDDLAFTGFDSSAVVESQTITVSYPNVESIQYTISIVESKGGISGTFSYGSSTKWQFVFNEDLTGEYRKVGSTGSTLATETFSYTLTDSHIRIYDVVISGSSTWTTDWFLTKCLNTAEKYTARETENDTGTYNETTFTINTYNTTSEKATLRTFTKI